MYLYYVGKYASTQNWVLEERERESFPCFSNRMWLELRSKRIFLPLLIILWAVNSLVNRWDPFWHGITQFGQQRVQDVAYSLMMLLLLLVVLHWTTSAVMSLSLKILPAPICSTLPFVYKGYQVTRSVGNY